MRLFDIVRKFSLGVRLNILAFLLFSLLLLATVLTTNNNLNNFILKSGQQTTSQDIQAVQIQFSEIEQETLNNTVTLSKTPGLSDAAVSGNIQSIQTEILISAARLNLDDVDVVNAKGRRLFDTVEANLTDEDKLIKLALLGFDATGFVVDEEEDKVITYIAAATPIQNTSGAIVGAVVSSQTIDNEMLSRINIFSEDHLALSMIVNGNIIVNDFKNPEDIKYFSARLLDSNSIEKALNGQTVLADQIITGSAGNLYILGHAPLTVGADTRAVVGLLSNVSELSVFKNQLIANQRIVFSLFALFGNIAFALFALFGITNPIRELQKAAEQFANGNYKRQIPTKAEDEVGKLANSFNSMSFQIQELITGLEQRVEQRTAEVEQRNTELKKTTELSEKRANDLQSITEIARYISTQKDLESLLPLITKSVSEKFGFYHVGIFLLNENKSIAVLRAANSPGGQRMLARKHKLEVGQTSIVGRVTSTGREHLALDTDMDTVHFNNPDLPETRSELAIPFAARGTIIGALDVQSTKPNAFSNADISILKLLADQLAIAIDNVILLSDTQSALQESQLLYTNYLADAWQKKSSTEILGYHQTLTGGQVIKDEKAAKEIATPTRDVAEKNTLAIPIRLHNQVIGVLNIRPNKGDGKALSADEVSIVQAVTERLGLALDNARLFEETSRRASRESLVSDITTKIRGTNSPQEMIKTAVEELQRALGASRVEIIPRKNAPSPDK